MVFLALVTAIFCSKLNYSDLSYVCTVPMYIDTLYLCHMEKCINPSSMECSQTQGSHISSSYCVWRRCFLLPIIRTSHVSPMASIWNLVSYGGLYSKFWTKQVIPIWFLIMIGIRNYSSHECKGRTRIKLWLMWHLNQVNLSPFSCWFFVGFVQKSIPPFHT